MAGPASVLKTNTTEKRGGSCDVDENKGKSK
jgi:hypothetical protein